MDLANIYGFDHFQPGRSQNPRAQKGWRVQKRQEWVKFLHYGLGILVTIGAYSSLAAVNITGGLGRGEGDITPEDVVM